MARDDRDETAGIEVEFLRTTGKAALFVVDGEEQWVPLSVVVWEKGDLDLDLAERGDSGTVHVEGWFADKEGLR